MNRKNSLWVKCEVVLIFCALLIASVYSNNDMVERVAVPSILVVFASVLMLVRKIKSKSFGGFGLAIFLFSLAASYFVVRAIFSPVPGLATSDLLLMLPAYLIALIASSTENRKVMAAWLPWFAVVVVAVQTGPALIQLHDPTYLPFREPIEGKGSIRGFFGHSNFFGALMGMSTAVLLSYATRAKSLSGRRQLYRSILWVVISVWALVMLYLSSSRGAWMATAVALAVMFLLALIVRVLINKKNLISSVVAGVVGVTVTVTIVFMGAQRIVQNRSLEDRGFFFSNARTDLLTLAVDCEASNVIVGGGSRFYLYESRRVWDFESVNNALGDAKFVHNEYIESLVNYGYIGFLIFIGLIGGAFVLSGMQLISGLLRQKRKKVDGEWVAMHLSILAVILIVLVQSLVDFTLHVLPLTLMAGLALGLLIRSKKPRAWAGTLSLVFAGLAVVTLSSLAIPLVASLYHVEKAKKHLLQNEPLSAAQYYEKAAEASGHFEHYSKAREIYDQLTGTPEVRAKRRDIGLLCYELHPYDGVNLISLVRVEQAAKKWDRALRFAKEAEYWVGQSERKYGAKMLLAEIKLRILQRDEKQAASKGNRMAAEEFEDRLLECWQYYQEAKALRGRNDSHKARVVNEIRVEYLLRTFFKYAILGEAQARQNKMPEALSYIKFSRVLYKRAMKISKGAVDANSLNKFDLTTRQMEYFKRFEVTIDQDLIKQLEQELEIR